MRKLSIALAGLSLMVLSGCAIKEGNGLGISDELRKKYDSNPGVYVLPDGRNYHVLGEGVIFDDSLKSKLREVRDE